ncbi:PaaI family thioesterase [Novosphingobium sp. Chol11]|uniref:PaaI family thioesterase n=1 Tax=Novosphingobium sp. Chol11 TaxID=1385763 RepID=UPI0025EC9F71|nr:PaaI family thioesterase [Novosphingobium sp. Chol11]
MGTKAFTLHGHTGFLGMEYRAHGEDWMELALPWREDLVGVEETGVLASGPIISLLDNATSIAVWVRQGVFTPQVTLDLRIDYVRAATPGKTIIARAECYQVRRSMAFVRGIAHDGDANDPVAHTAGIFMLVGGQEWSRT